MPVTSAAVRKHRAPKGASRLTSSHAPTWTGVGKHRAPKGALRRVEETSDDEPYSQVGKHRAPKGALRPADAPLKVPGFVSQKAPSAKRCIKTTSCTEVGDAPSTFSQKPPSAKRCIKTLLRPFTCANEHVTSETTERQKVH